MNNSFQRDTPGRRLREARKRYYRSASAAAEDNGWSAATVRAHENGQRGFNETWAKRYGRRYSTSWLVLLHGDGAKRLATTPPSLSGTVNLIGSIGAGAQIFPLEGDEANPIEAPPGISQSGAAYIIDGTSQLPVYGPSDIVFCDDKREGPAIRDLIGLTCAVQVHNGPFLFKTISPGGKPGRWTLLSHNDAPIYDVEIEWASFAKWHMIARRARRTTR